jgi:hypothetical protein
VTASLKDRVRAEDHSSESSGTRTPRTRQQIAARVAIGAAIALIAAMWIYGFFFASKDAVAKVSDSSWSKRAAEICDRRNDLLDQNAKDTRETSDGSPQAVGVGVANGTDIIEVALDEVEASLPTSAEDQKLISEWDKLYRIYIADRRATEKKLAGGEAAELNETTLNGAPISDSISDFTKVNNMDSCSAPTGT